MSSLVSVVGDRFIDDWKSEIADTDDPLFQFHTKFWGLAETRGEGEDHDMGVDGDDIIPECYVLDIGIRGLELGKIWVRADYIRIFNFAEEFYTESASETMSPCLVITGQPGVGKTIWRWYALRVCCAQKKPVMLYFDKACWLFVDEGVFKQPTSYGARHYKIVVWTLVDSMDVPLTAVATHGTQQFIIYTTSPTPSRWDKIHQVVTEEVCVMNPWTKAEIHRAALFRVPGVSLTAIDAIFDELGPTPRLCFGRERLLIKHRKKLMKALSKLTLSYLEGLSMTPDLALDAVSHMIYVLRRSVVSVDTVDVVMEIISPAVASKVVARLRALQRHELVRLFYRYMALPSTRKMAGDIFEAYCHVIFSTKIEFEFVPMVGIGGPTKTKSKRDSRWHSSHTEFDESEKVSLNICPSRVLDYSSPEVSDGLQIEPGVYYIPLKTNQVGIDSFILQDEKLYLLQMSVSQVHGIKNKLVPFLLSLKGLPPPPLWHFIFVKSPLHILACPVPGCAELRDFTLYSTEIEVKP